MYTSGKNTKDTYCRKAHHHEEFFAVKFEDNGCGIDETLLKHIGEPFYSVKEKGIGLGMTVSYRIMETHKGSINVSSQVNVGTSVENLLPKSTT